jgi:glucosamine-6-phosphate deaminase
LAINKDVHSLPAANACGSEIVHGILQAFRKAGYHRFIMLAHFLVDQLAVEVYPDRPSLGAAAAARASEAICTMMERDGKASVVFASAASQNEFLAALRADRGVDWRRVTVFHLDEYAGLPATHPASFRYYLRQHFVDYVPVAAFNELRGDAQDLQAECARYQALLAEERPGLVALGIGENGHLAFIDPGECDFHEPCDVRVVELDDVCRMQQVHDGAFDHIEAVPRRALSLTVPFFLRTPCAVVSVPGSNKQNAVLAALEGPITEQCPASALRQHPNATLFLDHESAAKLSSVAQA